MARNRDEIIVLLATIDHALAEAERLELMTSAYLLRMARLDITTICYGNGGGGHRARQPVTRLADVKRKA